MVSNLSQSAVLTRRAYDARRRETSRTDGRGSVTRSVYGPDGWLAATVECQTNATRYAYDAMGRLLSVTNALGGVTEYAYDACGRRTYEGGATYPVSYVYDTYGNRVSMTTYRDEDTAGDTTTWVYDEASGLLTGKTYADGHGPTYTYDANGRLATRTWARGVVTTYAYDGWGNLTSTTYSDGTPTVTYTYDAMGRQTSATDAAGTTTFAYDDYGEEAQVAVAGLYNKTLVRHRDEYGRDIGHTMDGTRKNIIEYDASTGRISREQLGGVWYAWSYLPGTQLKSSLSVGTAATTTWSYELHRDLFTQVKNTVFGSIASQYDYANDALGRRTSIGRSGTVMSEMRSDAYGYNDRSELTNAVKNAMLNEYSYQYDDIGNRMTSSECGTNSSYTANNLNQYTSILQLQLPTTTDFISQYDADGNQTLVKTATGVWSVAYNGENRPVSWQCGATNIVMKFDRMGRRVEYVECVNATTNRHQKFVYDGYLCIQRLNGANNTITDLFEWDPTEPVATRPLYWQQRTAQGNYSFFYTHDGNKNVSEVVSYQGASGIAAHYEYAPFGAVRSQTGSRAAANPYRFSSEFADDTLGLVYYNYRHYEPTMGRWMSRDPIEEMSSIGSYVFVDNEMYTDVLGLLTFSSSCNSIVPECRKDFDGIVSELEKIGEKYIPPAPPKSVPGESHSERIKRRREWRRQHKDDPIWQSILEIYKKYGLVAEGENGKDDITDSIWKKSEDMRANLQKIAKDMKSTTGGTNVTCCPDPKAGLCKNNDPGYVTDGGYVRNGGTMGSSYTGKIVVCPNKMGENGFASNGGCGCFMLHELMHKYGMQSSGAHMKSIENAMIEMSRVLLKEVSDRKCKGYGVND